MTMTARKMTQEDKRQLDAASEVLGKTLVKVLGPKLPGVTGYGPALDSSSKDMTLRVLVTDRAERKLQRLLPHDIGGVPVRLAVAGVGRLD
jgi:hypothetical protein